MNRLYRVRLAAVKTLLGLEHAVGRMTGVGQLQAEAAERLNLTYATGAVVAPTGQAPAPARPITNSADSGPEQESH